MIKKTLLIAALTVPFMALAQQGKLWLIKTGKLFDSETAQFKPSMDILVKNGRIEDVKPDVLVTAAEKKQYALIDLTKYTVLPGLIDVHTHLLYKETLENTVDLVRHLTMEGDVYRALYGAARAKGYLEAGITSVQDLGNSGQYADMALRQAIGEGLLPGPRMNCSGPGLAAAGAQMPGVNFQSQRIIDGEYRIVSGVDDAVQAVREHVNQGVNVIKLYADNAPNKTMLSIEEMRAVVNEAHRYKIRVTAHATFDLSIHNAVIAGVDCIEHGYSVSDSTLQLMAKKHVMLVPTDGDRYGLASLLKSPTGDTTGVGARIALIQRRKTDRLQRAIKAGVTIAYGSDDYADTKMSYGEPSKRNLIGLYEKGVPIPQVLQIATLNSAKELNRGNQIGILKKGYLADIIAVDNNVDKDISAVLKVPFVMKNGEVYVNK
ncbi:amidohydrolase family protein [Mucilaginibacter boryungensis]|uniref:Amidohydrolase family protein n=1 Tax=Mucilaginibacter boryungensis TaxID=768480 RepID=A0ABR9XEE8_9SPHI|nr:amidohydrolase family protein [Mucilaginibacter boryungensis]MBE9665641.1 amidohydrolase family protein [Mucilaginibacter boryungensis]